MLSDVPPGVSGHGDPSLVVSGRRVAPAPAASLVRVRLDIAYDGTDFAGWAVQPRRRTVQQVMQEGLAVVLRLPQVTLTVAGRTDAGVHATGQVAHCDVPVPPTMRQLAGVLPDDVRVAAVRVVPPEFDARFAGLWRRYVYRLSDAPGGGDPLRRRFVAHWKRPLDVTRMQAAAEPLLGLHDFGAFCRARPFGTTIRSLQTLDVERRGDEITCVVQADAFCHSMVRSLVGALVAVGEGRQKVAWPASQLGQARRFDGATVAVARGLTLVEVGYPPDDDLAARTAVTRALRG